MAHKFGYNASPTREERELEHMLHLVWSLEEEGDQRMETVVSRWEQNDDPQPLVERVIGGGLAVLEDGEFRLSAEGRKRAEEIVRRHRLAEYLLSEVFLLDEDQYEKNACEFEHILSPEVTESICTLLGHPPVCPHGRHIPRGSCCVRYGAEVKPLVGRLSDLSPGDVARIVFISSDRSKQLDRLSTMGLTPGTLLKLHQRHPSFILDLGETKLAVDRDIADEIYVKKVG